MVENQKNVSSGRISGLLVQGQQNGPLLILFNQWRSGAHSILSQYIAKLTFEKKVYSSILFLDRIASGGASDNSLSKMERQNMRWHGEMQFARDYADAIENLITQENMPKEFFMGGSSAGGPAALAAGFGFTQKTIKPKGIVLVEPTGLMAHGIGAMKRAAIPHALGKHIIAYRHRLQRGWWTPMDKEQYFAKGSMFEHRAQYWATDAVLEQLQKALLQEGFPPVYIVLSEDSHVHTEDVRDNLKRIVAPPHKLILTHGNHDVLCQPPHLSEFYSNAPNN